MKHNEKATKQKHNQKNNEKMRTHRTAEGPEGAPAPHFARQHKCDADLYVFFCKMVSIKLARHFGKSLKHEGLIKQHVA